MTIKTLPAKLYVANIINLLHHFHNKDFFNIFIKKHKDYEII